MYSTEVFGVRERIDAFVGVKSRMASNAMDSGLFASPISVMAFVVKALEVFDFSESFIFFGVGGVKSLTSTAISAGGLILDCGMPSQIITCF